MPTLSRPMARANENQTIYVADDDPVLLRGLNAALEGHGYRVRTAEDGPGLLSLMEEARPDLLLLDVMMPGMDGVEVLRRIRDDGRWRDLPVMMVTAVADAKVREAAARSGPADVVSKPFRLQELLHAIEMQLGDGSVEGPEGSISIG